jgi:hypothetical protein
MCNTSSRQGLIRAVGGEEQRIQASIVKEAAAGQ